MPAEGWRTMPARSISRCEAICASAGVSLRVGRKARDRRNADSWKQHWVGRRTVGGGAPLRQGSRVGRFRPAPVKASVSRPPEIARTGKKLRDSSKKSLGCLHHASYKKSGPPPAGGGPAFGGGRRGTRQGGG